MSDVMVEEQSIQNIANAIRDKGVSGSFTPGEMADAISQINTDVVWGDITGTLSNQTDLNTALSGKQATLVSGTNIKTINGSSILTSGNINASEVSVSSSGTSTTEAKYITVNGTEYKISGNLSYEVIREPWDTNPMTSAEATAAGFTWGTEA